MRKLLHCFRLLVFLTFCHFSLLAQVSLPFYESFDYTADGSLSDQTDWTSLNSGDNILISSGSLSYTGLKPSVGNSMSFQGAGAESYVAMSVTSGVVYASFIMKVTDQSVMTDLTDGGYFAGLSKTTTSYDTRLWVRPNPSAASTTYDFGFGTASSSPILVSSLYNIGDTVFVVMCYNVTDGYTAVWINPSASTFGGTQPTATLYETDASIATSIGYFIWRQDSDDETPSLVIDELRIGTDWASVTPAASSEVNITAFSVAEQQGTSTINNDTHIIDLQVVYNADLTSLTPTIEISEGATISPVSGVAQDFSDTVIYTVTAEDMVTTQDWKVVIVKAAEPSHDADIKSFSFAEDAKAAVINTTDATITSVVAWNADLTSLTPVFTMSAGAQVSSTVTLENIDFTNPYTIRVVAQDEIVYKDWVVTVSNAAEPSHEAKLLSFSLDELEDDVVIDESGKTVTGVVKYGTSLTALTPTITVSDSATYSPTEAQDFSSTVTYTVTAADGTTTTDYLVTLTVGDLVITPIYDIQFTTAESGDSPLAGETVFTTGIVTAVGTYGFYIQDSASAWNGIYVYLKNSGAVLGDSVVVNGKISEYYNLTEIGSASFTVISSGNALPSPIELDLANVGEAYEGCYIVISNVECSDGLDSYAEWDVKDANNNTLAVGDELLSYTPTLGQAYSSITGIFVYTYYEYKINPRSESDIVVALSSDAEIVSFTLAEQYRDAVINSSAATVSIVVVAGTDVTSLTPTITVSTGAQVSSTTADFTNPVSYTVYAEDGSTKDWTVSVSVYNSIESLDFDGVELYPNPVSDQLTISNLNNVEQLVVTNLIGQIIEVRQISADKEVINTSNYNKGIYLVTLISSDGQKLTRKIVKQ